MSWNLNTWRSRLRLTSALVLLAFVICHLTAHSFLLISLERADAALDILMSPWRTPAGTAILVAAALVHYANALWAIYIRRTLRFSRWEWAQLALGLCIPVLLMSHVTSTRIAEIALNVESYYSTVLLAQWVLLPYLSILQPIALLTVWTHACIGIHFWWRTKPWYPRWQVYLFGFALLLPALTLAGYVTAGNQVVRLAKNPAFIRVTLDDAHITAEKGAEIVRLIQIGWGIHFALVLVPFGARALRDLNYRRRRPPRLSHPSGRTVTIHAGATVLETLREYGIPHAAVCGGRARCTTCRILVTKGLELIPVAVGLEAKALARIGATPGMRLACQ